MSVRIDRPLIIQRAENRCEYCQADQESEPFVRFQVEHIVAKQHGGTDSADNLALACTHCNLRKGPNIAGIDPLTGKIEPLFHPRRQDWSEHFEIINEMIAGKSPCGRATVRVLAMNDRIRLELRLNQAASKVTETNRKSDHDS